MLEKYIETARQESGEQVKLNDPVPSFRECLVMHRWISILGQEFDKDLGTEPEPNGLTVARSLIMIGKTADELFQRFVHQGIITMEEAGAASLDLSGTEEA